MELDNYKSKILCFWFFEILDQTKDVNQIYCFEIGHDNTVTEFIDMMFESEPVWIGEIRWSQMRNTQKLIQ